MAQHTNPTSDTEEFEAHEAQRPHMADRAPTPAEEEAAERNTLDPAVAANAKEQYERGANVEGEGRID
jgi:hypothetical protein